MTRRVITALITALVTGGLLPLAAFPAVATPVASRSVERAAVGVRVVQTSSPFSPNGDGRKDSLGVTYRLSGAARVTVEVHHGGRTVFRTAPKVVQGGTRSFTWTGTRTSGKRAADGRYRVVVRATAGGTTRTDSALVGLHTRSRFLDVGTVKLSSDVVYPYSWVVKDVIVGNFDLDRSGVLIGRDFSANEYRTIEASRVQVLDRTGHVVSVEPLVSVESRSHGIESSCSPCGRFTWDGRDADGVRLAPGSYRIRVVQGRDSAGNVRVLADTQAVTVSEKTLKAVDTTVSYRASDVARTNQPWDGCNDCQDPYCGATPSSRFAGGLTFADTEGQSCLFTVPVPGRRTPYDRFSVAATGGPTTPGSSDRARLSAGVSSTEVAGDDATAAVYGSMTANSEVYPGDWPPALLWGVSVATGSYDIASFTVTITTYEPDH